jgi:hypothetical protein
MFRQNDKTAQLNAGIKIRGRDPLLLTSVRAREQLGAGFRKTEQLLIREIFDPLIDQVQIHVDIRPQTFFTEPCDC